MVVGTYLLVHFFAAVGGVRLWDLHSRNICRRGSWFSRVGALSGSNFTLSWVAGSSLMGAAAYVAWSAEEPTFRRVGTV